MSEVCSSYASNHRSRDTHHAKEKAEKTREIGQTICIDTQDDTKVTRVTVVIHHNGTILEQGEAVPSATDGSLWIYVTTTDVPTSPAPLLDANAYDMPGNFGAMSYQG